jgi:hypothetical protein
MDVHMDFEQPFIRRFYKKLLETISDETKSTTAIAAFQKTTVNVDFKRYLGKDAFGLQA